jgi:DNA polymerase-3 subunit epsilon
MSGCYVSGFNIRHFDLPILLRELDRCGCALAEKLRNEDILDLMDIFHQREPRDLAAAFRFYCDRELAELDIIFPGAHDAEVDATAAMCVFNGQIRRYEDLPGSLKELCVAFTKPGAVDIAGKLERRDGRVFLNFGKHAGSSLQDVEEGYLSWMLDKNVIGPDAVQLIKDELASRRRTFK